MKQESSLKSGWKGLEKNKMKKNDLSQFFDNSLCLGCYWYENDGCFCADRGIATKCDDFNEKEQVEYDLSQSELSKFFD